MGGLDHEKERATWHVSADHHTLLSGVGGEMRGQMTLADKGRSGKT